MQQLSEKWNLQIKRGNFFYNSRNYQLEVNFCLHESTYCSFWVSTLKRKSEEDVLPVFSGHRKAQLMLNVYPSFRLFHPKRHLRIFFNLFSLPVSHFGNICSSTQIHQLPGQAVERLTFPEDLSGQTSWNFLKLYPFTRDHQQLLITPMISARASFLVVLIIYNLII